jgi:hypothetical protein
MLSSNYESLSDWIGLFSALPKSQDICIINKSNISSSEIRGVTSIHEISMVKKVKNGREGRAMGNTLIT